MRNTNTKPVLRFPEFKENWKPVQLKEILKEHKSRNTKNLVEEVFSVAKEKGVINQIEHLGRSYASDDISNYKVVYPNDVVYTKSPTAGFPFGIIKQNKLDRTGVVSVLYAVFKPKNIELGLLLDFYFSSWVNTYNYLVPLVHKGAKNTMNIGNEDFLNGAKIYLPTEKEEQKKIADFLIQIDNRIAQLTEKKEHLELYKKGITQKIFSQKLRFKDENGKDFPEWKYLNGNKLFEPISNKNHNSDLPILAISQEFGAVPREMINYHISVTEKSVDSYKVVEKGDFIISLRSFQGGIEYSEYNGICSPAYIILRPKVEISDYFFKTYFKTNNYIQELCRKLEGIRDGKMISYKYFSEIKLPFPHIKEQEKIASFLNEISQQISLVNEQLEETRTFKKALLSKLFC
ncbi:MAG: restriction endonuclease subunit S [Crocinitomicaceae bacterium]|nr:restriction endonuclease subunit S [Crocinitomicaceae bacterium]